VLKRTEMRRYMMALLWHQDVPQGPDCVGGPLWLNCDGQPADVLDHETHQLFEDAEASYELPHEGAVVVFGFDRVTYQIEPTRVGDANIALWIDIIAHDSSGRKRQDMLDTIEERVLYRLLSYQAFTDATTGQPLQSVMRWLVGNQAQIESRDDSAFGGNYTIRRLTLTVTARECIAKTDCDDLPLCIDFTLLPTLPMISQGSPSMYTRARAIFFTP